MPKKIGQIGTRLDNEIRASLPLGYEAKHIAEISPPEAFQEGTTQRYRHKKWVLFIDGKRHQPDIDILAECIAGADNAKRVAAIMRKAQYARLDYHLYGDFESLVVLCSYLVMIGAMKSMPKAAMNKEAAKVERQLAIPAPAESESENGNGHKKAVTHLSRFEDAPSSVICRWVQDVLEAYEGDSEKALNAFKLAIDHIAISEKRFQEGLEERLALARKHGWDENAERQMAEKNRRKHLAKLAEELVLPGLKQNGETPS